MMSALTQAALQQYSAGVAPSAWGATDTNVDWPACVSPSGFQLVFLDGRGKLRTILHPNSRTSLGPVPESMHMQERWLSVDEIAVHLGVNPDTIYKWITRKKMPAHKLGRLWKFLASEVDQWIKSGHAAEDVVALKRKGLRD